ncbi:MAG: hypothetical protein P1P87_15975 [Trueperaceae bacterium]|nr:hypothetical protein [Trueperaceae bacterium]
MTRRALVPLVLLAALTLVLAGCQVTISVPFDPVFRGDVVAQDTAAPDVQATGTLGVGVTHYYRLDAAGARDLVYAELGNASGLQVALLRTTGSTLAVSRSETYFAGSVGALSTTALDVAPAAILVVFPCLGACAAIAPTSSDYVVAVSNPTGQTWSYELLAYTIDATDPNEPNDGETGATRLDAAGAYQGAIERLGDEDYFVYDAPDNVNAYFVVFDPFDLALGLELEILDCAECTVLDGTTGRTVEGLVDGDVLRVRSADGRAGPSAASGYSIEVTTMPPAGAGVSSR